MKNTTTTTTEKPSSDRLVQSARAAILAYQFALRERHDPARWARLQREAEARIEAAPWEEREALNDKLWRAAARQGCSH